MFLVQINPHERSFCFQKILNYLNNNSLQLSNCGFYDRDYDFDCAALVPQDLGITGITEPFHITRQCLIKKLVSKITLQER